MIFNSSEALGQQLGKQKMNNGTCNDDATNAVNCGNDFHS